MERNTYNKAEYPHGSRYIWELRKCNSVTFFFAFVYTFVHFLWCRKILSEL